MKKTVKIISFLLAAVLLASAVPFAVTAAEIWQRVGATSGTTGDCTWTLDDNGTLTISGNGYMEDYDSDGGEGSPWEYSSIEKVIIQNGVKNIGNCSFYCCFDLESVTIPPSVSGIGREAFSECENLTKVYITDIAAWCSVEINDTNDNPLSFAHKLYVNKKLLTELEVPDSVNSIGKYTFCYCTGLKSVIFPDSVTSIGNLAFYGCSGLETVTFGNGLTNIGSSAFKNTAWYNSQPNGMIYIGNAAYSYKGICPAEYELRPETVSVFDNAFENCSTLKNISIPNSVTTIGNLAFINCSGLTDITIPDSVTTIGNSAFFNCTGIKNVTIPKSVTNIGVQAFGYYLRGGRYTRINGFTVYGKKGSAAETYAKENGFTFVSQDQYEIGDANLDGVIDIRDVTVIQRHVSEFEYMTEEQLEYADVDGDGEVTVADATLLQMFLAEYDVQIS